MRIAAVILALLGSLAAATAQAADPDTILVNGKVVTVDGLFSIHNAVAIAGSRIAAVGKNAEIRSLAGKNTRIVDLGGKTVVPGLIDTHVHYVRAARYWSMEVRLDGVATHKAALDALKNRVKAVKPGAWVLTVGGWVETQFSDKQTGFTRSELDAIAPDNPVFLQVDYSHAYLNSAAFRAAGIAIEDKPAQGTAAPAQGHGQATNLPYRIERDANGAATGKIVGIAGLFAVRGKIFTDLPADAAMASAKAMAADFNRVGLTTVYDLGGGGTVPGSYAPVRALADKGELTLRVRHGLWITARSPEQLDPVIETIKAERPFDGNDFMSRISVGEVIYDPMTDWPAGGPKNKPEDVAQVRRVLTASAEKGWPVHIHAHFKNTISAYLDEIEAINSKRAVKPLRWQFVHADFVTGDELERMRKLGIAISVNASSKLTGSLYHPLFSKFDVHRNNMPPLRLLESRGIRWAFGSDATAVAEFNPFATLGWAVTGKGPDGKVVFDNTIGRERALVAHTRDAAYLIFEENNLGSIEPGKLADLVVLDADYLTVPADKIRTIRPTMVMVGGRVVHGQ